MKALSIVAQFPDETIWHLLQSDGQTCCGEFTRRRDKQGEVICDAKRQMIAMVKSADLCPKCQEALAKSRTSRAGLVHKKGAR